MKSSAYHKRVATESVARKRAAPSIARQRSSITNNHWILGGVDHRSAWMRRLSDLIRMHTADCGGDDFISEAQRQLIRRASMLALQLELMETRWAERDGAATAKELDAYQRASGGLRRLLESLGLERKQKPVPSLQEYIRTQYDKSGDVIDHDDAEAVE